jgi:hypothetical protein
VKSRLARAGCLLGSAVVCLMFAAAACSNQSEGDRCEFDNGNDDCQDGLICIPATPRQGAPYTVNPQYANSDRCCPPDQHQATHPACLPNTGTGGGDSAAPETGPPAEGGPDTGVGDASDAADAADAPNDVADAADSG